MIKVEVGQYRAVDKGALKAFFSLVIYPEGQKILDCRYFEQGQNRWWSMPQKEIKKGDGEKSDYIPYISYLDKKHGEELKAAVLEALKNHNTQETHAKDRATQSNPDEVQDEGQKVWF